MIPKFRAWNKNNKKMYEVLTLDLIDEKALIENKDNPNKILRGYAKYEDMVLMQSTGMKDKNGAEIYEGDIVKVETMGGVVYGYAKYKSFSFMICSEDMDMIMLVGWDYEILGNIYENPELMEV